MLNSTFFNTCDKVLQSISGTLAFRLAYRLTSPTALIGKLELSLGIIGAVVQLQYLRLPLPATKCYTKYCMSHRTAADLWFQYTRYQFGKFLIIGLTTQRLFTWASYCLDIVQLGLYNIPLCNHCVLITCGPSTVFHCSGVPFTCWARRLCLQHYSKARAGPFHQTTCCVTK